MKLTGVKMPTIPELEAQLEKDLAPFGAEYRRFASRESSEGRELGPHIEITLPEKLIVTKTILAELKTIVEIYFGKVVKITKPVLVYFSASGLERKSIEFILEED